MNFSGFWNVPIGYFNFSIFIGANFKCRFQLQLLKDKEKDSLKNRELLKENKEKRKRKEKEKLSLQGSGSKKTNKKLNQQSKNQNKIWINIKVRDLIPKNK